MVNFLCEIEYVMELLCWYYPIVLNSYKSEYIYIYLYGGQWVYSHNKKKGGNDIRNEYYFW